MTFEAAALADFAAASATALNGGAIELLSSGGAVLASAPLNTPAGTSSGPVTTFAGFPKTATAQAGTVASARLVKAGGAVYKSAVTVGIPGSGAQVIVNNGSNTLVLAAGQPVEIAASPTLTHTAPTP
jgi:hypothetical protein